MLEGVCLVCLVCFTYSSVFCVTCRQIFLVFVRVRVALCVFRKVLEDRVRKPAAVEGSVAAPVMSD